MEELRGDEGSCVDYVSGEDDCDDTESYDLSQCSGDVTGWPLCS